MIKDAINMYENKVRNENASPSKETKLKRTIREQIQSAVEKLV